MSSKEVQKSEIQKNYERTQKGVQKIRETTTVKKTAFIIDFLGRYRS